MTDDELIQVVARHLGWTRVYFDDNTDSWFGIPTEGVPRRKGGMTVLACELPNWLISRDAAHEVVMTLDDRQMQIWGIDIGEMVKYDFRGEDAINYCDVANATARQRIEAYLKVVEEVKG